MEDSGNNTDGHLITQSINFHGHELLKSIAIDQPHSLNVVNTENVNYKIQKVRMPEINKIGVEKHKNVINFISERADVLFMPQDEEASVRPEQSVVHGYKDKYHHRPPIEYFMNVSYNICKQGFFQVVNKGDILLGYMIRAEPTRKTEVLRNVRIFAFDCGPHRCIPQLNIMAKMHNSEVTEKMERYSSSGRCIPKIGLRVEVLNIDKEKEQVIVGTKGLTVSPDIKLGLTEFDLSQLLMLKSMSEKKITSFSDSLSAMTTFKNPRCIEHMSEQLDLSILEHTSLMTGLKHPIPEERTYRQLRKKQITKWAHKYVSDGVNAFKKNKTEDAFSCFKQAFSLDPENVEAFVAKGALLANSGSFDKAVECFEEAIKYDPKHQNACKYICETLLELGLRKEDESNLVEAEKCYKRCLEVNPNHEPTKEALNKLYKQLSTVNWKLGVAQQVALSEAIASAAGVPPSSETMSVPPPPLYTSKPAASHPEKSSAVEDVIRDLEELEKEYQFRHKNSSNKSDSAYKQKETGDTTDPITINDESEVQDDIKVIKEVPPSSLAVPPPSLNVPPPSFANYPGTQIHNRNTNNSLQAVSNMSSSMQSTTSISNSMQSTSSMDNSVQLSSSINNSAQAVPSMSNILHPMTNLFQPPPPIPGLPATSSSKNVQMPLFDSHKSVDNLLNNPFQLPPMDTDLRQSLRPMMMNNAMKPSVPEQKSENLNQNTAAQKPAEVSRQGIFDQQKSLGTSNFEHKTAEFSRQNVYEQQKSTESMRQSSVEPHKPTEAIISSLGSQASNETLRQSSLESQKSTEVVRQSSFEHRTLEDSSQDLLIHKNVLSSENLSNVEANKSTENSLLLDNIEKKNEIIESIKKYFSFNKALTNDSPSTKSSTPTSIQSALLMEGLSFSNSSPMTSDALQLINQVKPFESSRFTNKSPSPTVAATSHLLPSSVAAQIDSNSSSSSISLPPLSTQSEVSKLTSFSNPPPPPPIIRGEELDAAESFSATQQTHPFSNIFEKPPDLSTDINPIITVPPPPIKAAPAVESSRSKENNAYFEQVEEFLNFLNKKSQKDKPRSPAESQRKDRSRRSRSQKRRKRSYSPRSKSSDSSSSSSSGSDSSRSSSSKLRKRHHKKKSKNKKKHKKRSSDSSDSDEEKTKDPASSTIEKLNKILKSKEEKEVPAVKKPVTDNSHLVSIIQQCLKENKSKALKPETKEEIPGLCDLDKKINDYMTRIDKPKVPTTSSSSTENRLKLIYQKNQKQDSSLAMQRNPVFHSNSSDSNDDDKNDHMNPSSKMQKNLLKNIYSITGGTSLQIKKSKEILKRVGTLPSTSKSKSRSRSRSVSSNSSLSKVSDKKREGPSPSRDRRNRRSRDRYRDSRSRSRSPGHHRYSSRRSAISPRHRHRHRSRSRSRSPRHDHGYPKPYWKHNHHSSYRGRGRGHYYFRGQPQRYHRGDYHNKSSRYYDQHYNHKPSRRTDNDYSEHDRRERRKDDYYEHDQRERRREDYSETDTTVKKVEDETEPDTPKVKTEMTTLKELENYLENQKQKKIEEMKERNKAFLKPEFD